MKIRVFLLWAVFCIFLKIEAEDSSHPTICLNMIVKDEKDVIERCLKSTLKMIDYWVIVDTGSTDDTQEIIQKFMEKNHIPGELHQAPWVNFSHNRNIALQLAKNKADYLFFIDADEYLVYDKDFCLPSLDKDFYYINVSHAGSKYGKVQLINNHLDWKWIGVLHEYVSSDEAKTSGTLENVTTIYTTEGARSKDPLKYAKDAKILEEALKEEPSNPRYRFYLGQSYLDAKKYELAYKNYQERAKMGGWDQEVYWSLLKCAIIQDLLNEPVKCVIGSYRKAFENRPSRIEALYHMANFYRRKEDFQSGYQIASIAEKIPKSDDLLFVQAWMYEYGILLEKSISAYWIGKFEECRNISLFLLKKENLPENIRECVKKNLDFANIQLVKNVCDIPK